MIQNQFQRDYSNSLVQKSKNEIQKFIKQLTWRSNLPRTYYSNELGLFLEDYLSCTICTDLLDEPFEFDCHHIFCLECVKTLNNSSDKTRYLKCPICNNKQSRVFEQQEESEYLKLAPSMCNICFEMNQNTEECKSQPPPQIWSGSLEDLEDHLYFNHGEQGLIEQQKLECENSFNECSQSFEDYASLVLHQTRKCDFRWVRCLECLKVFSYKYFNAHNCLKNKIKSFGELVQIQANYKNEMIKKSKVLLIFDPEEEYEGLIEYFIDEFMRKLKKYFLFEEVSQVDQNLGRLITFTNQFMLQNFIESFNNKTIHPKIVTYTNNLEDQFEMAFSQPQFEQKQLFDPSVAIENEDLTIFFSRCPNGRTLRMLLAEYAPIKSFKIFGRHKLNKKLFGIMEFYDQKQVNDILIFGRVFCNRTVIYVKKFVRK